MRQRQRTNAAPGSMKVRVISRDNSCYEKIEWPGRFMRVADLRSKRNLGPPARAQGSAAHQEISRPLGRRAAAERPVSQPSALETGQSARNEMTEISGRGDAVPPHKTRNLIEISPLGRHAKLAGALELGSGRCRAACDRPGHLDAASVDGIVGYGVGQQVPVLGYLAVLCRHQVACLVDGHDQ